MSIIFFFFRQAVDVVDTTLLSISVTITCRFPDVERLARVKMPSGLGGVARGEGKRPKMDREAEGIDARRVPIFAPIPKGGTGAVL